MKDTGSSTNTAPTASKLPDSPGTRCGMIQSIEHTSLLPILFWLLLLPIAI